MIGAKEENIRLPVAVHGLKPSVLISSLITNNVHPASTVIDEPMSDEGGDTSSRWFRPLISIINVYNILLVDLHLHLSVT